MIMVMGKREAVALQRLTEFCAECPDVVMPSVEVGTRLKAIGQPVAEGLVGARPVNLYQEMGPHNRPYLGSNDEILFPTPFPAKGTVGYSPEL